MKIILYIGIGLLFLAFVYFCTVLKKNGKWYHSMIQKRSFLVTGHKGTGKDLFFQKMIAFGDKCYCNIPFGFNSVVKPLSFISAGSNTYENFLNDCIVPFTSDWQEKWNYWISDAGNFLPASMNDQLKRKYPSMPIAFTLSRHFWDACIHANCQWAGQLWKQLRELADDFVVCKGVIKLLPLGILFKTTYYSNVTSAENGVLPLSVASTFGLSKQEVKQTANQFQATNGEIRHRWLWIWKSQLQYDSRYFKRYNLGSTVEIGSLRLIDS